MESKDRFLATEGAAAGERPLKETRNISLSGIYRSHMSREHQKTLTQRPIYMVVEAWRNT